MLGASARYSCCNAPVETITAPRRRSKLHIAPPAAARQVSLIPLLLLSPPNPLTLGFGGVFFLQASYRSPCRCAAGVAHSAVPPLQSGTAYAGSHFGFESLERLPALLATARALKDVTPRLLATRGFPPSRAGLRAAARPSARPRSGPSALLATARALKPSPARGNPRRRCPP